MFSVNALWKNKIAVLSGDFLLSRGLLLAIETENPHLLEYVSKATRDMSEGELLQVEKARKMDFTETLYYEVIRKKTASLLASCFATGAYSTVKDKDLIEKMWRVGELTGIAFQIMDDVLDYEKTSITGKPTGIDIKEKKVTLPLIYLLNHVDKQKKRKILSVIKHKNNQPEGVAWVIREVKDAGGLDFARKKMNEFKNQAIALLREFPENESRQALEDIIEFTISRKK
jgi:octaprenyl-diphosphate synthase